MLLSAFGHRFNWSISSEIRWSISSGIGGQFKPKKGGQFHRNLHKRFKIKDRDGLFLEIMPTGAKFWRIRFRLNNTQFQMTIGKYPFLTLLKAREEQAKIIAEVKNGNNPITQRLEREYVTTFNSGNTLKTVGCEWHETNKPLWKPRYSATILHRLEKYVFPTIGNIPLCELTSDQVLHCLKLIDKTAPEMARRVKNIISHIFRFAKVTGRAEVDITIDLQTALKKYKKSNFASIDLEELPAFILTFHNHKARVYRQTYLAIKLMFLTFVRTTELMEAKWSEIDFENAKWIIPPERMKMGLAHIVPLSTQAVSVLTELKDISGHREFIFPSIPRPLKPMSNGTILVALKRMGYSGIMTGHGFRALALGILTEKLEFSHSIADRQLAHVPKGSTNKAYDRAKFLPQRIIMMQKYADYLDKVLTIEIARTSITKTSKVVCTNDFYINHGSYNVKFNLELQNGIMS